MREGTKLNDRVCDNVVPSQSYHTALEIVMYELGNQSGIMISGRKPEKLREIPSSQMKSPGTEPESSQSENSI